MTLASILFPYIPNRRETPEQQLARLRAEMAVVVAAERVERVGKGARAANDNQRERRKFWWQESETV